MIFLPYISEYKFILSVVDFMLGHTYRKCTFKQLQIKNRPILWDNYSASEKNKKGFLGDRSLSFSFVLFLIYFLIS